MKKLQIEKNGLYIGTFIFDESKGETMEQFCVRVSNVNQLTRYELKVSGDAVRTYKN